MTKYIPRVLGGTLRIALQSPMVIIGNHGTVFVEATTLSVTSTIGKRSTASMTVKTDSNTRFMQYEQVWVYDNTNTLIFSGYIQQSQTNKPAALKPVLEHRIACIDQHYLADKRIVAATYANQSIGFIVNDILNNILAPEGVTVGQITDNAVGHNLYPSLSLFPSTTLYPQVQTGVLPSAVFAYCTAAQALDELAKVASLSGVLYYWQIDQYKKLWFVPYTAVMNSTLIDGTQIDDGRLSGQAPTVTSANPAYRNTQYLTGGVAQTVTQTEIHVGDGNSQSFTMGYALSSAPQVFINTGSGYIAQSVGLKGASGAQWYWAAGDPVVTQDPAGTKLRGSPSNDTLKVVYVGQYPSVASDRNMAQISYAQMVDGSTGIIEEVEQDNTITSLSSGLLEAGQLLTRYAQQGAQFVFTTRVTGFAPGQQVTVNLPDFGLYTAPMLIESVQASDQQDGYNIWYQVTGIIGPYDVTWTDFFSKLLAQQAPSNSVNVGSGQSVTILVAGAIALSMTLSGTATPYTCPLPSPTLYPSASLLPC